MVTPLRLIKISKRFHWFFLPVQMFQHLSLSFLYQVAQRITLLQASRILVRTQLYTQFLMQIHKFLIKLLSKQVL